MSHTCTYRHITRASLFKSAGMAGKHCLSTKQCHRMLALLFTKGIFSLTDILKIPWKLFGASVLVGVFRCFSLLSDEDVENMGVRLMPGYKDPFHKRLEVKDTNWQLYLRMTCDSSHFSTKKCARCFKKSAICRSNGTSSRGAAKLIAANPMKNLLPVDEYLPILYDKHPS
ncbi:unnamed protein product [Nesidiocoris tenuis]|uniref:Uncharacterized protein n=1 Tax=Nesidiocoris tenuis TaxID=355587 RepID=A0A6H5HNK9_9HEMI|nr:unnamed protein product [Nesidiocoris tenuis]